MNPIITIEKEFPVIGITGKSRKEVWASFTNLYDTFQVKGQTEPFFYEIKVTIQGKDSATQDKYHVGVKSHYENQNVNYQKKEVPGFTYAKFIIHINQEEKEKKEALEWITSNLKYKQVQFGKSSYVISKYDLYQDPTIFEFWIPIMEIKTC